MLELDLQLASEAGAPSEAQFRQWCELALRQRSADSEMTIRLVDEPEARELNHTWRQKDYATNVLSFPAAAPAVAGAGRPLGDLVICAPVLAREAREQGKSRVAHWAHLVVHGSLHLLGFDHEQDGDARRMERRERRVLAGLGFPDPYAPPPARRRATSRRGQR